MAGVKGVLDEDTDSDEYEQKDYQIHVETSQINIDDDNIANKDRYTTDLGLYGFGMDYNYRHLKPFKANKSLKDEMLNTKWITEEIWCRELNKAFSKLKMIVNDKRYTSKQYSNAYGIARGQTMSVHHLLVICFYTDISNLCTDYRSTFRRIDSDTTEESIRIRHSKYYFFSRFLFEALEMFGNIMKDEDVVYHGLDQQFLFAEFSTHFNAPTSTTPSIHSAKNFAKDGGIILGLTNGNQDINKNQVISKYQANQPRFLDVSWISDFGNELEYLFYGNNIIFKIYKIIHQEVPKNTLRQLNLLQEIIENREINWEKQPKSRMNKLCKRLEKIREMNLDLSLEKNKDKDVELDNEILVLKEKLIESMPQMEFIKFAQSLLQNEAMASKYKWKIQKVDKSKIIDAFGEYCQINDIDGQMFNELSRKMLANWIKTQYNLKPGKSLIMHRILKNEIDLYNGQFLKEIENKEKEKTERFNVPYYLKLFHYFTVCRNDFVCINAVFNIPRHLQEALLIDPLQDNYLKEEAKNNGVNDISIYSNNYEISLTKLTNIFSNVSHIAFIELKYDEMVRFVVQFCKAVIKYQENINNNKKKLKLITLKSKNTNNSKVSAVLQKTVKRYQNA
eukprot:258154_1